MITEFFLNIIFNLVSGVFAILPDFQFSVQTSFFTSALDMVRLGVYMLPMGTIITIITIIIWLMNFRIAVSILKTIWEILPLV